MAAGSSTENPFFKTLLGDEYKLTPAERGIRPSGLVKLYLWNQHNEKPMLSGFALAEAQPGLESTEPRQFRSRLHGHELEPHMMVMNNFRFCTTIATHSLDFLKTMHYPYKNNYRTTDDRIEVLGQLPGNRTSFVWDNRAMLIASATPTTRSIGSSQRNTSEASAVVEVTNSVQQITVVDLVGNDDEKVQFQDTSGRDFTPNKFDLSNYRSVNVRVKISQ